MAAVSPLDVLSLAKDAYNLYSVYRGAQDRYAALCEDISSLEATLKVLGNRLVFQDADDSDGHEKDGGGGSGSSSGGLSADENDALQHILAQTAKIIGDLRAKVPEEKRPRGLYRFKWTSGEVAAVRSRITAVTSAIAAFNSSIVVSHVQFAARTEKSQRQILDTLREILLIVKGDGGSGDAIGAGTSGLASISTTTLVASTTGTEVLHDGEHSRGMAGDTAFWDDLVREMRRHGVMGVQIDEQGQVVLQSAAAAVAPGTMMPTAASTPAMNTPPSSPDEDEAPTYEVLSAVYGPLVVTPLLRRMFDSHVSTKRSTIQFTVTNAVFGGDPFYGHVKAFSMVWRKRVVRGNRVLYSSPQRVSAAENTVVTVNLDAELSFAGAPEAPVAEGTTQVIMASWNEIDVTERVATLVGTGHTVIKATNAQLFAQDPAPAYRKTLTVCWTYARAGGVVSTEYETVTALQDDRLEIPPHLHILCANWGGLDITPLLQGQTTSKQTLQLDPDVVKYFASPDPWVGVYKTIAVVYQYGASGEHVRLLVTSESEGMVEITPYDTTQRGGIDWVVQGEAVVAAGGWDVVAVVWGMEPMPLSSTTLIEALKEGRIECTNDFFGVDGWLGMHKTCQVFVKGTDGTVRCCVAREGTVLDLSVLN